MIETAVLTKGMMDQLDSAFPAGTNRGDASFDNILGLTC